MVSEEEIRVIATLGWERFIEMLQIPLKNTDMLWAALPLVIAVFFMTLYFGRYKQEELGWTTAFGNTMVFLFVAINLIKHMYIDVGVGSLDELMANPLYLILSLGLAGAGLLLMFITYFHLIPKSVAFFLFSAPPLNVSTYVIMTMIYANVPADWITLLAGIIMLIVILAITKFLKIVVYMILGDYDESLDALLGQAPRIASHEKKSEDDDLEDAGVALKKIKKKSGLWSRPTKKGRAPKGS